MLYEWASVIGLALTALGILIGFYRPTVAGVYAGPETETRQFWLRFRVYIGVACILIGTTLQIYGAWPS